MFITEIGARATGNGAGGDRAKMDAETVTAYPIGINGATVGVESRSGAKMLVAHDVYAHENAARRDRPGASSLNGINKID